MRVLRVFSSSPPPSSHHLAPSTASSGSSLDRAARTSASMSLPRRRWDWPLVPGGCVEAPPRAMSSAPPFVRPPKPFEPPAPRVWSMDAAGRSWDVFGYGRSAWNRDEEAAWDCFGFHIWPRWNEVGVEVFRMSSVGRLLSWYLAQGVCTAIHGSADPYVMMRTAARCLRIAGFGWSWCVRCAR